MCVCVCIYIYTITVVSKSPLTTSSCFVSNNNVIITQKAETRWNSMELGGRWCTLRHSPWKKDNLFFPFFSFFLSFFILESYSSFHDHDFAPHNDIVFPPATRPPLSRLLFPSNGKKKKKKILLAISQTPFRFLSILKITCSPRKWELFSRSFFFFFFFFFLNISRKILFSTVRAINLAKWKWKSSMCRLLIILFKRFYLFFSFFFFFQDISTDESSYLLISNERFSFLFKI